MKALLILILLSAIAFFSGRSSEVKRNSPSESDAMGLMLQLYSKIQQGMAESAEEKERENIYSLEAEGIWVKSTINAVKFYFDTSAIKERENTLMAQLKLNFLQGCHWTGEDDYNSVRCRLKGVLSDHCDPSWNGFHKEFFIYRNEQKSFDITRMMKRWKERGQRKGCLSLSILYSHAEFGSNLVMSLMHSLVYDHRPVLLVYTEDDSPEDDGTFFQNSIKLNERHDIETRQTSSREQSKTEPHTTGRCKLANLYVDFKKIGLNKRIIAPKGMNINYCIGQCIYPFPSDTSHTLHAEMQALLHATDHRSIPRVCCSPVRYQPTALLYYTENRTLTLKRFNKMSVKQCGCT